MKEEKKKACIIGTIASCILMMVLFFPALAMEKSEESSGIIMEENRIAGGNVTDSVTWKIVEDESGNQTLVIGGNGPMKDYSNQSQQPWAEWKKSIDTLVIEDGVTRIGNYSMYSMGMKEVQIGKSVEAIGQYSFAYGTTLKSIRIPGNVKTIEANAFVFHYALRTAILEEGVETLEQSALGSQSSYGEEFYIPASLRKFDNGAVWMATSYKVAEDNPYFAVADGVLYNKEMTALVDYPKKREAIEYRIPDCICEIRSGALQRIRDTGSVYIPSSVQKMQPSYLFQWSDVEEVYVDDGVPLSCNSTFYACRKLARIRLPENIAIDKIGNIVNGGCDSLESIKIPNGVQYIEKIGDSLKALTEITYDAECAKIKDNVLFDSGTSYDLIIGANVDSLPREFKWLSQSADTITFMKPNTFLVDGEAFYGQDSPLDSIEGMVHVDEQGVLYRCDEVEKTARIICCLDEFQTLFIPAQIQNEDNEIYTVTSVGRDAFKNVTKVQSITFEKPEQIKQIEAYGFANCTGLTHINMLKSVAEIKTLFSGVEGDVGYRAFYNTSLIMEETENSVENLPGDSNIVIEGKEEESDLIVSVESEGSTLEWSDESEKSGGYRLLTGDTLTVLTSVGNKEAAQNQRYRVYFQHTGTDCSLSVSPGEEYYFDDQKVVCNGTEDPNCVYIEFSPLVGKTLSIPVTAVYPSPVSKGGNLTLWAVSFNKEEAEKNHGRIVLPKNSVIRAVWRTDKDDFILSNTEDGEKTVLLQGTDNGTISLDRNLQWKTVLMREETVINAYGKDYIRSVDYKETLILPEGMTWKEEVRTAVNEGSIRRKGNYLYAGDIMVCNLNMSGGQLNLSAMKLQWDENLERLILTYKVTNTVKNAEMNTNTLNSIFYPDAFDIQVSEFATSKNREIVNIVEANVNYQHSECENLTSSASKTIDINPATIKVSKSTITKPQYFGENIDYEIVLTNSGALPYFAETVGSWTIEDTLSPYIYLEPEAMEKMFEEEYGKNLIIEVSNTEYVEWNSKNGVLQDSIYWENGYNSGVNLEENANRTIKIRFNEDGTRLQVEAEGKIYTGDTLKDSFMQAGFAPGRWTEYRLLWTLNDEQEVLNLNAGKAKRFHVYGKVKDTFHMLSEDWPTSYPTDASLILKSTAFLNNASGKVYQKTSVTDSVIREVYVGKKASIDGNILKDSFTAENGDCITYSLEVRHHGNGNYSNLPIIDEMYGSQALLVETNKNPDLSDKNLAIHQRNGKSYYVLTEGNYSNIVIGGAMDGSPYIAANITVEKVTEERTVEWKDELYSYKGLYTRIEWNWADMPAGRYRLLMSYEAIVQQELSESNIFTLGNLVWMNDRKNSRIHAGLWGGGSIIDFRKEILEKKGTTWQGDKIDGDGYSILNAGESVTYRMTLRNKGDGQYEVYGNDIADKLPDNGTVFKWIKNENVTMSFESTHDSTVISNVEQWTIEDKWNNKQEEGQQYILWSDETKILFREPDAKVYLYVTLSYPDNKNQTPDWYQYVNEVKGTIIENTFFVYQFPVNVTHHLNDPGQVILQKGVYGTSYEKEGHYQENTSRHYYNNTDSHNRQVIYYVFLHNAGTKRWYLNDIYDCLPEGFEFKKFVDDADLNKKNQEYSITTRTEFEDNPLIEIRNLTEETEEIQYCSATIQWQEEKEGRIKFQISGGSGDQAISYDEEREQYFLNQNEAILFGYMCNTGFSEKSKDAAINSAFMHYEDYPKTGIQTTNEYPIRISGVRNDYYADQNDGGCSMMNGADIKNQYSVIYGDICDTWLFSEVNITRGEIIPGVTKYTESFTSLGNGLVTEYRNAVGPFDQINWRVRLQNSGTSSITDYSFEDILPSPYVLCDTVKYELYDYRGTQIKKHELFRITERKEDEITIINNNSKKLVSLDGKETEIYISNNRSGSCSISKTEQGNEILTIHFSDYTVSIPEGGYMDLYLSSYNPTNQYNNTVYTNQAVLIPNKQRFDTTGQGSIVKDDNDVPVAVRNYSPVTVSFGYATGSQKAVWEKADSKNKVVSTDLEHNFIILSEMDHCFTYELTVTNDTDKPMEKLVLIDNLPEEGDSSPFDSSVVRQSQFKVRLQENADIKVVITKDQEIYELDKAAYTVSYSQKTVFDREDWQGISVWDSESENARSIRIIIKDDNGAAIPEGARVSAMFDCSVSEGADAGETAWNSFGYHYKLKDIEQELEAMPMPVGVKIADVPTLEKLIEDRQGDTYNVKEDTEFRFIIYEGDAIETEPVDSETMTEEEWITFLTQKNIHYNVQSVIVKAGNSKSEPVNMELMKWIHGKKYTIVEVQNHDSFDLKEINGVQRDNYTFVYDKTTSINVSFVNVYQEWTIELLKMDENKNKYLEAAVFALYSPEKQEGIGIDSKYEKEESVFQTVEYDGQTWYLYRIDITDSKGKICWEHLRQDKYFLLEIEAPDGYKRQEEGQIVYGKNAENGIVSLNVTNERGQILPRTGGTGKELFIAVGIAFMILSCRLHHDKRRLRRKTKGENI